MKVKKWYRKGRKLFEQTLEAKKRKRIAIDERNKDKWYENFHMGIC